MYYTFQFSNIDRFPWISPYVFPNFQHIFPTCQARVVRFYVSLSASFLPLLLPPPSSAGPQLQALDRSVPRRTRTATSGSKWSPPVLNCKLLIAVFPVGPQQQPLDQSGRTSTANSGSECSPDVPGWTSTASSGSKCSPLDLNGELRIRAFSAGPRPLRISEDIPDRVPERMSEDMPDTYARKNIR